MGFFNRELISAEELQATVADLLEGGWISEEQARQLAAQINGQLQSSEYVLRHLSAHIGIGVIFAFDVIPLPLGTLGRISWVAGARLVETLRGRFAQARVHSLSVFLVAIIPWFGYAAYLLPLRRDARELAFVLANHSWQQRTGDSYEAFVVRRTHYGSRFVRWVVPLPW